MALTPAERQARYRSKRHRFFGSDCRLNTFVSTAASLALARLAGRYGVTKREILERLIADADQRILDGLDPDTPEWDVYFGLEKGGGDAE